jgi:hypothetical protein
MPDNTHAQQRLAEQAEAKLNHFMRHLYTAITQLNDLALTLTPEQKQIADQVRESLFDLNDSAKTFAPTITEMGQVLRTLLHQRQTSKEAFMAGWHGLYRDMLAQLSPEDRDFWQPILDGIMSDDDDTEIPF